MNSSLRMAAKLLMMKTMNNIFVYTTQLEPDTGAVRKFLYDNINKNDII